MDIVFNYGCINYGKKYNDKKKFNILKYSLLKCFTIQL